MPDPVAVYADNVFRNARIALDRYYTYLEPQYSEIELSELMEAIDGHMKAITLICMSAFFDNTILE